MKFFDNIKLKQFEKGLIDLSRMTTAQQDNDDIVYNAILKYGAEQFEYASERLRSETDFILRLVRINPKVLKYVVEPIRQNYIARMDGKLLPDAKDPEPHVSYLVSHNCTLFEALCMKVNPDSYKYMNENMALKYLEFALADADATVDYYTRRVTIHKPTNLDREFELLHARPTLAKILLDKGYKLPEFSVLFQTNESNKNVDIEEERESE